MVRAIAAGDSAGDVLPLGLVDAHRFLSAHLNQTTTTTPRTPGAHMSGKSDRAKGFHPFGLPRAVVAQRTSRPAGAAGWVVLGAQRQRRQAARSACSGLLAAGENARRTRRWQRGAASQVLPE